MNNNVLLAIKLYISDGLFDTISCYLWFIYYFIFCFEHFWKINYLILKEGYISPVSQISILFSLKKQWRTKSQKVEPKIIVAVWLWFDFDCSTLFDLVQPCSMSIIFTIFGSTFIVNTVEPGRTQSQSPTEKIVAVRLLLDFIRLCSGSTAGVSQISKKHKTKQNVGLCTSQI